MYLSFPVSIVEMSVDNGTLDGKLSCPPLPTNVKDLELPISGQRSHAVVCQSVNDDLMYCVCVS